MSLDLMSVSVLFSVGTRVKLSYNPFLTYYTFKKSTDGALNLVELPDF